MTRPLTLTVEQATEFTALRAEGAACARRLARANLISVVGAACQLTAVVGFLPALWSSRPAPDWSYVAIWLGFIILVVGNFLHSQSRMRLRQYDERVIAFCVRVNAQLGRPMSAHVLMRRSRPEGSTP